MKKRQLVIKQEENFYYIYSYDGTEYWDIDGPYKTEIEAEKSLEIFLSEIAQKE